MAKNKKSFFEKQTLQQQQDDIQNDNHITKELESQALGKGHFKSTKFYDSENLTDKIKIKKTKSQKELNKHLHIKEYTHVNKVISEYPLLNQNTGQIELTLYAKKGIHKETVEGYSKVNNMNLSNKKELNLALEQAFNFAYSILSSAVKNTIPDILIIKKIRFIYFTKKNINYKPQ
jgi:hypothetical protein